MGYVTAMGDCGCCEKTFTFNPLKVPSHKFDGVTKEPICKPCIKFINNKRKEKGIELWPVADDAYEACKEEEL